MVKIIGDQSVGANRLLSAENSGISGVYFQQQRPLVPAEVNLLQDVVSERRREGVGVVTRPGFVKRTSLSAPTLLSLIIPEDYAVINGETIHVIDGSGSPVAVTISDRPVGANTYDIVFLEAWYAEVAALGTSGGASTTLPANGQAGDALDLASDSLYVIKDPLVTSVPETTRRIQLRWRIRVHNTTVNPGSGDGLTTASLYARGDNTSASGVSPWNFSAVTGPLISNLYRAGDGSVAATGDFKDVAGYVWAIPVCTIVHTSGDTLGGPVDISAITDQRKSATAASAVSVVGDNIEIIGDDVIFKRTTDGVEIGRFRSSSGAPYDVESAQLVSTVSDGTTSPILVTNRVAVQNLVATWLADDSNNPIAAGNSAGNIPVSNGSVNINLVAQYVGTGGFTATYNNNTGNSLLKLDASGLVPVVNLPAAGPATSATRATYLDDNGNDRAASYFLPANAQAASAVTAGYATNAGNATSADTAKTASVILNQANSATITAVTTATPSTIALRDATGAITGSSFLGNLTGQATSATKLQVKSGATIYAAFPREETFVLLTMGSYTPHDPNNIGSVLANAWAYPFNTAAAFYPQAVGNPTRFAFKPSFWSLGTGQSLKAKVFGYVCSPTDLVLNPTTYGFRLRAPGTNVFYASNTTSLATASVWDLADTLSGVPSFDLTAAAADQTLDGIWTVEILGGTGVNQWMCAMITMRVWVE